VKTLTVVLGAILMLALGSCAEDPVKSNIAILKSPTSTPEQKAAARRFLEWELAQSQRNLEFERQKELAEAYGRAAAAPARAYYDDQQEQLDRIERQNREIQQDLDNIQAQRNNGGHW
jgi:hypothetical protein